MDMILRVVGTILIVIGVIVITYIHTKMHEWIWRDVKKPLTKE